MKYAVEVAGSGSLNKASEVLLIAQSELSRSIGKLEYDLGIVRYADHYDKHFKELFGKKDLCYEVVTEFRYKLLVNRENPIARRALTDVSSSTSAEVSSTF